MPSQCKYHLDTADAKRPKHHLDTSRKPPKPQAKKLFHVNIKQSLEPQSTCPAYANTIWTLQMQKDPSTIQTASQKTVSRYLWNPHKTIFGATEHMPSLCKYHLDTADAKRPKHHLDTSRKPPKPQAKKLFHVTFGIHIKQSLEPQSTCPAYANTIWNHIKQLWSHSSHAQPMQTPSGHCRCKKTQTPSRHEPKTAQTASQKTVSRHVTFGIHINNLWSHRAHAQPMQTPSGHCRCKKTQTPSRHEPKPAQTASQKTVSRYLWNPHKTIFGATEHKPSLCKHKPMQTPSGHCRCKKTQTPSRHEPKTAQTASQKTVSRYLWNPHKTIFGATEHMPSLCKHHLEPHKTTLEPQSTCPAYANTIWTLQMQKDPNTI